MKLSASDILNLQKILVTCSVGDINSIIIEDGWVRGKNEAKTCLILSNSGVPALPMKMGLSRLPALKQRLDLFSGGTSLSIDAVESERGEIRSLDISSGSSKVQFRCTSTMLIKAPKGVNDTPAFMVHLQNSEIKFLLNAIKIMGGQTVQLIIKANAVVSILISDAINDVFSSSLETVADALAADTSATHYYHANIFYAALRTSAEAPSVTFKVGKAGTIQYQINDHAVILMPKVSNEQTSEEG